MKTKSLCNSFLRLNCLIMVGWSVASHAAASEPAAGRELFAQPGTVIPAHLVRVTPAVPGLVAKVRVAVGDAVKAGDVLVELDATKAKMESELAQVKAELARARYQALKADLAEKAAKLGLSSKELPSPGKEQLGVAEADVKTAEAELRLAKSSLEATQIRAPSDGTILAKRVEVGDFVNPQQPKNSHAGLFDLADLRQLEVVADVPEGNVSQVFQGQKCRVEADAVPKMVYQGKVVRVSPVADSATRCFRAYIEIQLPKKDNRLLPGMYTRVGFQAEDGPSRPDKAEKKRVQRQEFWIDPVSGNQYFLGVAYPDLQTEKQQVPVINVIRVEGGKVEIIENSIKIEGGKVEIQRQIGRRHDPGDAAAQKPALPKGLPPRLGTLPTLPPNTLPPVVLPFDPTGTHPIGIVTVTGSADPAPPPKVPKELLEKRLEAARKVFEQNHARLKGAQALPSELFGWSERWLEAELALAEKPADWAKALQDHLDRTREVERAAVGYAKTGQGRQADADAATYYRLEAEIRLLKEGVEPHPAKGEKDRPSEKK